MDDYDPDDILDEDFDFDDFEDDFDDDLSDEDDDLGDDSWDEYDDLPSEAEPGPQADPEPQDDTEDNVSDQDDDFAVDDSVSDDGELFVADAADDDFSYDDDTDFEEHEDRGGRDTTAFVKQYYNYIVAGIVVVVAGVLFALLAPSSSPDPVSFEMAGTEDAASDWSDNGGDVTVDTDPDLLPIPSDSSRQQVSLAELLEQDNQDDKDTASETLDLDLDEVEVAEVETIGVRKLTQHTDKPLMPLLDKKQDAVFDAKEPEPVIETPKVNDILKADIKEQPPMQRAVPEDPKPVVTLQPQPVVQKTPQIDERPVGKRVRIAAQRPSAVSAPAVPSAVEQPAGVSEEDLSKLIAPLSEETKSIKREIGRTLTSLETLETKDRTIERGISNVERTLSRKIEDTDRKIERLLSTLDSLEDKIEKAAKQKQEVIVREVVKEVKTVQAEPIKRSYAQPRSVEEKKPVASAATVKAPRAKPETQTRSVSRSTMSPSASSTYARRAEPAPTPTYNSARRYTNNDRVAPHWILRSARPGQAVLADRNSQNVIAVKIGDYARGVGRINSIAIINGRWVVSGSDNSIRQ